MKFLAGVSSLQADLVRDRFRRDGSHALSKTQTDDNSLDSQQAEEATSCPRGAPGRTAWPPASCPPRLWTP